MQPILCWLGALEKPLIYDIVAPFAASVERGVDFLDYSKLEQGRQGASLEQAEGDTDAWRRRHALSSARTGGTFPEIVFRRVDDDVEISWLERLAPSRAGCSFLAKEGVALVSLRAMRATIHDLRIRVREALDLGDEFFTTEAFESLLDRIRALGRARPELVLRQDDALGTIGLLAQSLEPVISDEDLSSLIKSIDENRNDTTTSLATSIEIDRSSPPYSRGYAPALQVRAELGLSDAPIGSIDEVFNSLGIGLDRLPLSSTAARSIATADEVCNVPPRVICNTATAWHRRHEVFRASAMHALRLLLLRRSRHAAVGAAFGTARLHADRSREAGAFSAMMLVPDQALETLHRSADGVRQKARECGVSPSLLVAHANNRGYLSDFERDQIAEEIGLPLTALAQST